MNSNIELNDRALKQLIKAFKGKLPVVKVGILGKAQTRYEATFSDKSKSYKVNKKSQIETSNATIGARHEFGLDGMPVRSFLRMPLIENLNKALSKAGAFDDAALKKVIQSGTIRPWMNKVGVTAVAIVLDAFKTGGGGKWPPSNMARKKVQQTLVETGQLRNSITWELG